MNIYTFYMYLIQIAFFLVFKLIPIGKWQRLHAINMKKPLIIY